MTYNINIDLPKIDLEFATLCDKISVKIFDVSIPKNNIMSIDTKDNEIDLFIRKLFFEGVSYREIEKKVESEFNEKRPFQSMSRLIKKNGWDIEKKEAGKQGVVNAIGKISQENKDKLPEADNKKNAITLTIEERYNDAHQMRKSAMKAIYDTLFVQQGKDVIINPELKKGTVLLFAVQLYNKSNDDLNSLDKLLKEMPKEESTNLNKTWFDEFKDKS